MIEACNHAALKRTLVGFRAGTRFVGVQELPGEGTAYMGQCLKCHSTLSVAIDLVRGSIVRGEIGGLDVAVGTVRAPGTNEGSEE